MERDRGAFNTLLFRRCEKGFVLIEDGAGGLLSRTWAFDDVQGLAAWLVDQYGEVREQDIIDLMVQRSSYADKLVRATKE